MQTISTNKSTVLLDDFGRWIVAYGKNAPDVGGMHVGARYYDTDDNKEYYWTGSAWSEIESNPNFNAHYWDDLRFPANGINPPGAAGGATIDSTSGLLSFAGNADQYCAGVAQMPHAWDVGTAVRPHVHLIASTADAGKVSRWKFEYSIYDNNLVGANNYGTYTTLSTVSATNPNSVKTIVLPAGFGDLSMTGFKESSCILWKVSRLASSDGADNDSNAWILVEFDIHYQVGKAGTITEIPT